MAGESPFPKWEVTGVLPLTNKCPRRSLDRTANLWIDLYPTYRNGNLWAAGGVGDQPAKYLAAMQLIESTVQKVTTDG